jgi:hypothetical protein
MSVDPKNYGFSPSHPTGSPPAKPTQQFNLVSSSSNTEIPGSNKIPLKPNQARDLVTETYNLYFSPLTPATNLAQVTTLAADMKV